MPSSLKPDLDLHYLYDMRLPDDSRISAAGRWRAWSQQVLDTAVEMITADANTILVSADVDFQPGYVRIVYRSRWWPRVLGFRGEVPASAEQSEGARREFAEYLSRLSVCEPLGAYADVLTIGGGIEWWGDGYPTLALSPNVSPLAAATRSDAEADDDAAWARWRSLRLIPQTDMTPARWLAGTASDALPLFPARAALHADEEAVQDFEDLSDGVLEQVSAVLARHTDTADQCWFGVWTELPSPSNSAYVFVPGARTPGPTREKRALPSMITSGPRAEMGISTEFGTREYILFSGPVSAATDMGFGLSDTSFLRSWPNVIWPTDHAWLAECGIDDDAVTISGSAALLDELGTITGITLERTR